MKKLHRFSFAYWYYALVRQRGSTSSVALGVAIGLFIGFLIPMGGQMIIAMILAIIFKASKIMSLGCTWVTNPYTVPFIYPAQCYLGSVIMGSPLHYKKVTTVFSHMLANPNWSTLADTGREFLVPFFVGGFTIGLIAGFLGYFTAYGMIDQYRSRRKKKLNRKLATVAHRDSEEDGQNL